MSFVAKGEHPKWKGGFVRVCTCGHGIEQHDGKECWEWVMIPGGEMRLCPCTKLETP